MFGRRPFTYRGRVSRTTRDRMSLRRIIDTAREIEETHIGTLRHHAIAVAINECAACAREERGDE